MSCYNASNIVGYALEDIEEFSDDRQKGWCVHCGASITASSTNWDHVPTKGLLDRPLPPHVPQVEVCSSCNNGFSLDEEYFVTFLSCVFSGSTDPASQISPKVQRALERNPALRARLAAAHKTYTTVGGAAKSVWQPELERIRRIVLKNARGHGFYEFGEPMLEEPDFIAVMPLQSLNDEQRIDFENVAMDVWPEVGSRMMTRFITGQDMQGGWVVVQDAVYRYAVFQEGTLTVRSVIREYLATEVRWD
ncbi:hypothetical protein CHX26_06325 [Porphyrobacter sp. HT-58-2]|uniref:hypothetical protein n=1 Tax=Porphyrobacter sp. HT-58-2 TaxID=2023229 RepID=UPI000CDBE8D3|nr:hypothetical protein [Porphyrobacter sp. HT-58-2]AUX69167.1 hypothetical protein CHX26_06325 [Porphyrobacter sp. HT-58-2]